MKENVSTEVLLADIALSTSNQMFRSTKELTPQALGDLASSIRQYGVIQPVLVRPSPEEAGKFILISGERRYRASLLADKTTIPAYVKDVTEEVALVLQITENMQREDVHALNEAKGYRMLLENQPELTTAELALRVGKSETYVLLRLKLNDLVREAKRDFYAGSMSLGHALILARLTPQDQREAISSLVDQRLGYETVSELQEYIDRHVTHNLTKAPFKLEDEMLYKKAGSCLHCAKRSGASPKLFPDIKEKDTCFDKTCFLVKWQRYVVQRVRETIETRPEVALLMEYREPVNEVLEIIAQHQVKPLKVYDDFSEHNSGGEKVKGLWVSGNKAGQIATVYLTKQATGKAGIDDPKIMVEKIKHRMERGKELDAEKVYAKILESLKSHPTQTKDSRYTLNPDEDVFMWFLVFDKAGYHLKMELSKIFGIKKHHPEELYTVLKKLRPEQKAFMIRRVMLDQYGGNHPDSGYAFIIRKIAANYGDIDIKGFEKEQHEIRQKREERAKERINALKKTTQSLKKEKVTA